MDKRTIKSLKSGEVRVRIAPSPTGYFHIGNARTALFNYLFAKQKEGSFILRIEDTDTERSDPLFEKDIIEGLKWLGIKWSEGPDIGGNFGPYRQSQRREIYAKYLQRLLNEDKAYYCFCSKEELEAQRQYQMSRGEPPRYSGKCAHLSKEKVKRYLHEGKSSVIRFRVASKKVQFNDLIRGKLTFDTSLIGDIIIAKDFFDPLYNFAAVVDDFEMRITHIIRGEDHLSNTPKQILIQEALGFPTPVYAHLPLILGPDRTKLSKRHGAVAISEYKKEGYLPEALINFMAFLGWNPGGEREIYSLASLIKEFSIERIQKSGAIFNIKRLDFLNGFYIRQKSVEKLTQLCLPYLIKSGLIKQISPIKKETNRSYQIVDTKEEIGIEFVQKIVSVYQGRLKKLSEIPELTDFFFKKNLKYNKDLLRWKEAREEEIIRSLERSEKILTKLDEKHFTKDELTRVLMSEAARFAEEIGKGRDRGYLLWPLRVALSGKKASAAPFEIAEILGKEKTITRIKLAKELFK